MHWQARCIARKGGGVEFKDGFYSADGQFENTLRPKIFYNADEVPHILNEYLIVQTDLENPDNILKSNFTVHTTHLKARQDISYFIAWTTVTAEVCAKYTASRHVLRLNNTLCKPTR